MWQNSDPSWVYATSFAALLQNFACGTTLLTRMFRKGEPEIIDRFPNDKTCVWETLEAKQVRLFVCSSTFARALYFIQGRMNEKDWICSAMEASGKNWKTNQIYVPFVKRWWACKWHDTSRMACSSMDSFFAPLLLEGMSVTVRADQDTHKWILKLMDSTGQMAR